eukprot:7381286-Prymnesium_polylepis.1
MHWRKGLLWHFWHQGFQGSSARVASQLFFKLETSTALPCASRRSTMSKQSLQYHVVQLFSFFAADPAASLSARRTSTRALSRSDAEPRDTSRAMRASFSSTTDSSSISSSAISSSACSSSAQRSTAPVVPAHSSASAPTHSSASAPTSTAPASATSASPTA